MRRATGRKYGYNPKRRRRARRNPQFLTGMFALPPIKSIAFVGLGLVVPPMIATRLMAYLPVEYQTSKVAYYGVKAASVLIPAMVLRKVVSREAGNLLLLGAAASFALDLLRETGVLTTLGLSGSSSPFLGQYAGTGRRLPGGMRGVGRYPSLAGGTGITPNSNIVTGNLPERFNAESRF